MATDDELRDGMARAMAGFLDAVAAVRQDDWGLPTPCVGWSVFDVVDHVVAGDKFAASVLAGASVAEAAAGLVGLEGSPSTAVLQVSQAASAAMAAFDSPLEVTVDHPVGPIPARRFLGFRVIDQLGHTWDLATAIHQPVELDPDALAVGVEVAMGELEMLEQSTHFATSPGDVAATADPLTTFLQAIGRRAGGLTRQAPVFSPLR